MKLGQLKEHINNILNRFFSKNYAENKVGKLVTDLFLFLKKASYEVNLSGVQLPISFIMF